MNFQFSCPQLLQCCRRVILKTEEVKKIEKYIIFSIAILTAISLIASIWLPMVQAFRIVFGSVYVLFLPGLVLSFVFFDKKEIDFIERTALSFALSIAVVPLLVFYLNLIGMKINLLNTILIIALIIISGTSMIIYQKKKEIKIN